MNILDCGKEHSKGVATLMLMTVVFVLGTAVFLFTTQSAYANPEPDENGYVYVYYLDEKNMILNEHRQYDRIANGYYYDYYDNCCEAFYDFTFEIKSIESSDPEVLYVTKSKDNFNVLAKKVGSASLTVKYIDRNNTTQTMTLEIDVEESRYSVEFDTTEREFLIGKSLRLKANGYRETINIDYDPEESDWRYKRDQEGFEYRWSSDKASVHVEPVEGKPGYADVTTDENYYDDPVYSAEITVEIWAEGKVRAEDKFTVYPRESYFEVVVMPGIDRYMKKGQSVTISPKLRFYHMDASTDEGYDEVDKVVFTIFDYDPDVFTVKDLKGKKLATGDVFTDSCTVTRKNYGNGFLEIEATIVDEDSEYNGHYFFWSGYVLGFEFSDSKIDAIKNVVYNGKAFKPSPTVMHGVDTLIKGRDYNITYKNNKNVGAAKVIFTGKGDYFGTITKTFKINPKGTSIKKLKKGKKSFTVIWKKQPTQTTGYQIRYSLKKNFKGSKTVTIKKNKTVKTKVKKLKSKKKYYVKIRTYKQIGKTRYYSTWSKAKTVKTR